MSTVTEDRPIWHDTAAIGGFACDQCGIARICAQCGTPVKGMGSFHNCNGHAVTPLSARLMREQGIPLDYHENCHIEGIGRVDLIVTDPPWGYSKGKTHPKHNGLVEYPTIANFGEMFSVFHAALKPDRNCWVFTDWMNQIKMVLAAEKAGFTYHGYTVVKRKKLGLGSKIRKNTYLVLLFSKGKAIYAKESPDYLAEYLGEFDCELSHKDPAIYQKLIAHSTHGLIDPVVLDPFPATHEDVSRSTQRRVKSVKAA